MLTRSRAKAANQPIFVDDQWNDAYIHAKDEQIDAMHAQQMHGGGWENVNEDYEDSEMDSDMADGDEDDADVWRSDDEANADSTDEEEDEAQQAAAAAEVEGMEAGVDGYVSSSRLAGGVLAENVFWTVMTVLVVPMFLFATVLKRNRTPWPLQSASATGTIVKVSANLLAIAGLLVVFYSAACSTKVPTSLSALLYRNLELNSVEDCSASFLSGWKQCLAFNTHGVENISPLCAQSLAQGTLLVVLLLLLCCFHRLWLKVLLLWSFAGCFVFNAAIELQAEKRAAVLVFSLDPTFAFANETIFVAIDGQNLVQGGIVAWVPYWGGIQQLKAHKCPKLFPRPLDNGGVLVTFDRVNEYIPCYSADAESSSEAAFRCFEDIKLRVKDQKSVPGWSLHAAADERSEL